LGHYEQLDAIDGCHCPVVREILDSVMHNMHPLPRGITGFDAPKAGVGVKPFAQACYAAARDIAGHVASIRSGADDPSRNYHEAILKLSQDGEGIRVLCNVHYPIFAFVSAAKSSGDLRLDFVDRPDLAKAFPADFSVLSAQEASLQVSDELIANLSKAEVEQLRYWRPSCVGELIFNYWD
jgi:hypothetical protein